MAVIASIGQALGHLLICARDGLTGCRGLRLAVTVTFITRPIDPQPTALKYVSIMSARRSSLLSAMPVSVMYMGMPNSEQLEIKTRSHRQTVTQTWRHCFNRHEDLYCHSQAMQHTPVQLAPCVPQRSASSCTP